MTPIDNEDARWRIAFARILLGLLTLYDLTNLLLIAQRYPSLHTLRAVAPTAALLALAVIAVLTMTRMPATSIISLAIMSLISIWSLLEALLKTRIFTSALDGPAHWRATFIALLWLAICSLPMIVFLIVWPLRPTFRSDVEPIEAIRDS